MKYLVSMGSVGKSIRRIDAEDKTTGRTRYGADFHEKGMLYAGVLRSEHAFADVLGIDTSAARAVSGVAGVYTAPDVGGTNRHGLIARDQTVFAETQVRYMGDAVAMVVGETQQAVGEALSRIKVDYRPHEAVCSMDQALADDAPKIHPYGNVMGGRRIRKGDAERAFHEECDVIVEETFNTQTVDHAFLDLEAGWAVFDGDMLNIHAAGQWVHEERRLVALALGVPIEKVRIIQPPTGGAFGGREDISIQIYLGLAALKHPGRKIYIQYSRSESMRARHKRHAVRCHYTLGAKADGTLVAARIIVYSDEGAYASTGLAVQRKASSHATGPYRIPNVSVDVYGVHTNNNPTGAMRGFGAAQMAISYEGMMDRLAARLKIDRLEIRRKNLLKSGESITTSQVIPLVTADECIDAVLHQFSTGQPSQGGLFRVTVDPTRPVSREKLQSVWQHRDYNTPSPWLKRGYGLSVICFGLGYGDGFPDAARARVRFNEKGEVEVYSGAVDVGQGLVNMIAQVTAEETGMPLDRVRVFNADTAITPEAGSSSATRQTFFTGNAVKLACSELREHMLDVAGMLTRVHPLEMRVDEGVIRYDGGSVAVDDVLAEAQRRGVKLEFEAVFKPRTIPEVPETGLSPRAFITYLFGAHLAQVLVDTETGEVRVERHIACHDVGRAINPQQVEGQIQGGVAQGIGMALMEEVLFSEQGRMLNPGFTDYIIPTIHDVPPIEAVILEHDDPAGPFGARGVGEPPLIGATPAVLAAIGDALKVPVAQTPATSERIWKLLQAVKAGEHAAGKVL